MIIWTILSVVWASASLVLIYFTRKQRRLIVEVGKDVKHEHEQRDYWFQQHNKIRELLLHVASEIKETEILFEKKEIGSHRAVNILTAIITKMTNDVFRDQYIFSVTEMKEKHAQEAKEKAAMEKINESRKKMKEIEAETPKLAEIEETAK